MTVVEHFSEWMSRVAKSVNVIRFFALVVGSLLTVIGQYYKGSSNAAFAAHADTAFWVGLATLLLTNLLLVFVDSQAIGVLKSLHKAEEQLEAQALELEQLDWDNKSLSAWLTLSKLLAELIDQAIEAEEVDESSAERLYQAAVEFIADYKARLFGFEDDYANISIYELNSSSGELECVACYRSRPSDAEGPHRAWRPGEGHIGKAFELQRELVCADARMPDVACWIAAPPGKDREDDGEKYVSLAAVPISIRSDNPIGVIIMTSSEPRRFVNGNETSDDYYVEHGKYAVASLQDIAAQIAQLMCILKSKKKLATDEGGEYGR